MSISHLKILSYQSDWPEKFEAEREKLRSVFGDKALVIEHIGSTSIPGLSSKNIVDIAVMIKSHEDADAFTESLARMGYKFHSKSTERHFYTKGDPIKCHLSIAYADRGGFWTRQISFRDYLRSHSNARDEYARLKDDLLKKDSTGRGEYIKGKTEFIDKILALSRDQQNEKS